jgi:hypothetical protein
MPLPADEVTVEFLRENLESIREDFRQVERELVDAKRMIALLVAEAGGKVSISRRAIAEISDETVIETTQDVVNGGWVIRTRVPS